VNVIAEPDLPEKVGKPTLRGKPAPEDGTVPLSALPAPLRKLLEETPRKEWYQIRAVRATYEETIELAMILSALQFLRKVTPEKLLNRVTDGQVEERYFYGSYREIRDQIRILREKCEALGRLSGVEVKAWSDGRGRKRKAVTAAPAPATTGVSPEKLRKVS
jgi:hypothetical protein